MHGKTVVITGANGGIGAATALELVRRGAEATLLCRSPDRGEEAAERIRSAVPTGKVSVIRCDLANLGSVRAAAEVVLDRHPRIDVLVNNAGLFLPRRQTTSDGFEATVQINHLGPFLLTALLAPRLLDSAPARIVNVSSEAHRGARLDFDDLMSERRYRGFQVYGTSKLMNVLHARALARRLEPSKVTVNALHPGVVNTGFAQDEKSVFGWAFRVFAPLFKTPEQGAATTITLASDRIGGEVSGRYFANSKEKRPSAAALDDKSAERLYEESERLTKAPPLVP